MLSVKNISKKYRRKSILEDININFALDKTTALVGPNGVGKTTLLKIMMGLERQNTGSVLLNGNDITKWPTHKRVKSGISYMSQFSTAITDLTVEDNIYLIPPFDHGKSKKENHKIEEEYRENLLTEFNLQHVRHNKCKNLSGGELKKLEFCLCMATRPKIICLDEPFSGLDPKSIKLVTAMIKNLQVKGVALIIVDHRIDELQELAEDYVLLYDKRVSFTGNNVDFFEDQVVSESFLG